MRATLILLMMVAGCGGNTVNMFELDIEVNAPGAASALVDGKTQIPAVGGIYSRGYPTTKDAMNVSGTVATVGSDGATRATAAYQFGHYCDAYAPLLRQTERFAERVDSTSGAITLALDTIECEKNDGTGAIVTP